MIFFPVVASIYYLLAPRTRWLWLLLASCIFYMSYIPVYLAVLFVLIVVDYNVALLIEKSSGARRKMWLILSICSTCGILFVFKYFDFFNSTAVWLSRQLGWVHPVKNLSLILPLGLSFHTFQSLGYVIEVYRGKVKAQRHFGFYSLYVMFFPQLVSGPIERAAHLLPELQKIHHFRADRVCEGLKWIVWGLFQKTVIADRLALVVARVYAQPEQYQGPALVLATVFFSFQIYCDFCGYTDIAIGASKVLGIDLVKNFRRPYLADSIFDFWHRWHISLSTWFRDYLYIPLGGNQAGALRWSFNILVTFVISGLWHGAKWTFVVWGAWHGLYYLLSCLTKTWRHQLADMSGLARIEGVYRPLKIIVTFTLVCFAWIFFRSENLSDAGYIIRHLLSGWNSPLNFSETAPDFIGLKFLELTASWGLVCLLIGVNIAQEKGVFPIIWPRQPVILRWTAYAVAVLTVMNWGVPAGVPFIYFQF